MADIFSLTEKLIPSNPRIAQTLPVPVTAPPAQQQMLEETNTQTLDTESALQVGMAQLGDMYKDQEEDQEIVNGLKASMQQADDYRTNVYARGRLILNDISPDYPDFRATSIDLIQTEARAAGWDDTEINQILATAAFDYGVEREDLSVLPLVEDLNPEPIDRNRLMEAYEEAVQARLEAQDAELEAQYAQQDAIDPEQVVGLVYGDPEIDPETVNSATRNYADLLTEKIESNPLYTSAARGGDTIGLRKELTLGYLTGDVTEEDMTNINVLLAGELEEGMAYRDFFQITELGQTIDSTLDAITASAIEEGLEVPTATLKAAAAQYAAENGEASLTDIKTLLTDLAGEAMEGARQQEIMRQETIHNLRLGIIINDY